jgi:2-methylisocitrate lyase-like PEP mutase family enzyme
VQLRSLHVPGKPIVLTNVYDAHTAKFVASNPSCPAIATASYAIAAVHGLEDDALDLETHLAAIRRIAPVALANNKPLTVDLQDGYGDRLEEAVEAIIGLGASGCNLEDRDNVTGKLYPLDEAVSRVRRVLDTAKRLGVPNFALNARSDAVFLNSDVDDAIARGKAYLEAGATTAFVWGGPFRGGLSRDEVVRLVEALGGRLNVIARDGGLTIQELADIGVARISIGPRLWRAANAAFENEATKLLGEYAAMKPKSK